MTEKAVVYQLVVRTFGNTNETRKKDGTIEENGVGKFADIDARALASLRELGVTHVWLTGVLRQATLTDYASIGMPADSPNVVKGLAGSFYAVRDYYDVCPDYAIDPPKRLDEFDALVGRIHAAGLRVLIDLVPNHVARGYGSVVKPEADFGRHDDQTKFSSPGNDFFYLGDPPGLSLALTKPRHWNPPGVVFDGTFERESGGAGRVPKVTGNNVVSPHPSDTDWYETVKLNYGYDFLTGAGRYDPMPSVWPKIDAILAYWQARGVDGFRCDFAHWVPNEAWRWLIARIKERDPRSLVIAEAYADLEGLIAAGFDAVYHDESYDTMKLLYTGERTLGDLDRQLASIGDGVRDRYVFYLENHDERRIASPIVAGRGPDATGLGSASAVHQLGPISFLATSGPVLVFAGQEVGERGEGDEGFQGEDGRTTIFDYWSMPAFVKWVNGHAYDSVRLSQEEKTLRSYYADLLHLCQDARVRGGGYWGLAYFNQRARFADANDSLFSFARFAEGSGSLLLVVANFAPGTASSGEMVRVPDDLAARAGLARDVRYRVRSVLDERGAVGGVVADEVTRASLAERGFDAVVADQSARVFVIDS